MMVWYEVILILSHSSFYPKFCLWAEAETRQKLLHIFLRIREQQNLHLKFFDFIANLSIYWLLENWNDWYHKVVSSWLSWLVAHPSIFKLFMKGKFDAYVYCPKSSKFNSKPDYCSQLYGKWIQCFISPLNMIILYCLKRVKIWNQWGRCKRIWEDYAFDYQELAEGWWKSFYMHFNKLTGKSWWKNTGL